MSPPHPENIKELRANDGDSISAPTIDVKERKQDNGARPTVGAVSFTTRLEGTSARSSKRKRKKISRGNYPSADEKNTRKSERPRLIHAPQLTAGPRKCR